MSLGSVAPRSAALPVGGDPKPVEPMKISVLGESLEELGWFPYRPAVASRKRLIAKVERRVPVRARRSSVFLMPDKRLTRVRRLCKRY